jgi:fatty acid desaturase
LTYPGYDDEGWDRVVGRVGGFAALGVALFPTAAPEQLSAPSWWQIWMRSVHYLAATLLFVSFILFSIWLFRKSSVTVKQNRPPEKQRRDRIFLWCGIVMIGAVLWAASSLITGAPIFYPEAIAIVAFAISWLVKGEARRTWANAAQRALTRVRAN